MKAFLAVAVVLMAAGPASAQNRSWPSEAPPRPLAARQAQFPPYEVRTLANGLQVVAVLHHEQPVVSMRMIVRAGAAQDPRERVGLANLAASLLDQGTTTKSAQQVNDEIDFMGGAMGAGAGTDLTFVNIVVMKDSFEAGLGILSDLARKPGFAPEEIERQRQQALSTLQVNSDSPEFVADAVFDRLVYGFHPYGMPQNGTSESLTSITRADLVAFHDKYFVPNNAILAVVGDVTADEAFASAQKVFGDWEKKDLPASQFIAPPDPARRVIVVNKPDAVQTEVRAGHLGIKRNQQDYMALNMTLRILGGEGANRLHQVLRTERGLTYGAKADMDTLLEAGDFEASTNTRSDATGEVLRLIVDQFWRLQRERVGERELSDAKAYVTGSFPLTIETPDAIATQVLNVLFYGLPVEQLQSYRERVNAVGTDDIERAARYYLRPDRLSIVLVGNAAAFLPQLRGLGFNNVEMIEMTDLDLMSVDFRRPGSASRTNAVPAPVRGGVPGASVRVPSALEAAYQPATSQSTGRSSVTAEEGAAARALLDRVVAAKGGLERLRAVKSIVATTSARPLGPNAPTDTASTVTYIEYPNHVRVESTIRGAQIVQVYDGTRAWVRDPNGTHDVPERMLRDFENGLRRDTIRVLLAAIDGQVRVRRLSDVKDDKGVVRQALELSGANLEPMVMYIDPSTGLVSKQTYVAGGMGQPLVEETFSDYRVVDGVQINYAASVNVGGEPALERTVIDVKLGGPLNPTLFQRPASLSVRLLLSCGEASGDLYAGALTRELRALSPDIEVAGLAGPEFVRGGGRLIVDYRGLSVTGFTEIVAKVPQLRAAKQRLLADARQRRPSALVVIDYFGFNGRLARDARALGIPVIYYVSPQIWAWRPGRIKVIREVASRVLVIFPFEEQIYRDAGVPVEFVGHPLVDLALARTPRAELLGRLGLHAGAPTVAVLPGSRTSELRRILPTLVEAATRIRNTVPATQFVFARAPHLDDRLFEAARGLAGSAILEGETDAVLAAADIVLTASGTATVQAALHDKPMVVVYRVSSLEYRIGRPLVKVDTFAMVNLIAGSRIVPELIQNDFTAEGVAAEAVSMLTDPARAATIRKGLADVRARLGGPGGSRRAAQAILRTIGETCETVS